MEIDRSDLRDVGCPDDFIDARGIKTFTQKWCLGRFDEFLTAVFRIEKDALGGRRNLRKLDCPHRWA
jgi:hypothetical protein